ncbi:MAG TPA: EF-hand domain-containing protein [Verrucomicrobiae bacterium]|nr:EF-hand domain-containing protein [Verrucomicrobiae bacterium]
MKLHAKLMIAALAIAASTIVVTAQDNQDRPRRQRPEMGQNGHRPPPPPLLAVLDANHDGVIDASEIDNSAAALRTLDKNGDGKLTVEELRPKHPRGAGGPEGRRQHHPPTNDGGAGAPPADDAQD